MTADGKKRYNLHLNEENTEKMRAFLKHGRTSLSNYVDGIIAIALENLDLEGIEVDQESIDARKFIELIGLQGSLEISSDQALEELMENDPELALKLIKDYKFSFSERYYQRKKKQREQTKEE